MTKIRTRSNSYARKGQTVTAAQFAALDASKYPGAVVYVSDTGVLWLSNGMTWIATVTPAPVEGGASLARTPSVVGGWYVGALHTQVRSLALSMNTMYLALCYTESAISIDQLTATVATAGSAGAVYRVGVYLPGSQANPFALTGWQKVSEGSTQIDVTATGIRPAVSLPTTQIPEKSWFATAGALQVASGALMSVGGNSGLRGPSPMGQSAMGYDSQPYIGMSIGGVTSTLPSTPGAMSYQTNDSGVSFRRSA